MQQFSYQPVHRSDSHIEHRLVHALDMYRVEPTCALCGGPVKPLV